MWVSFVYSGPGNLKGEGCGVLEEDIFGVKRRIAQNEFSAYQEITCSPLADAATAAEIEAHSWPSPDWFDYESLPELIDSATCNRIFQWKIY